MAKLNEVADRKELKDILRKCRCCLRLIIDDRRAVGIDDAIRNHFFELTNLEVSIKIKFSIMITKNYVSSF